MNTAKQGVSLREEMTMFDAFVTSARDTIRVPFSIRYISSPGIHCLEGTYVSIDATDGAELDMREVMQ